MALHDTGAKIGMAVVLFFQICGWAISLAGTADATNQCRENTTAWSSNSPITENGGLLPFPTDAASQSRAYDCGIYFSLHWWIIAFQLFIIIYGYMAVFVELFHSKFIVMNMFAISTALYTLYTSVYVKLGYSFNGGDSTSNKVGQAFKTASAGGIVVLVSNYIFMFVFGSEESVSSEAPPAENKA